MLKWIVGSKVDHPLADLKQARALVAELPAYDCLKSLDEITQWLESLSGAEGFRLDRLYEVIDLLDSAAKNHQRKLVHDYLGMSRQQKAQESRLWTAGFDFSKALSDTYLLFVKHYDSGAAGASAVKKQIPVVVARALRSLSLQVKWVMLRYGPFEARLWGSIGDLYRHAEAGGYINTPLEIYRGAHGSGTVQQEYLKVLMLWASSADVLPPLKQEIAERAVAYFANSFRLDKAPFPGAMYSFDPTRDRPPVRLFGDAEPAPSLHFFGPGDARAKLADVVPALEKTGALPADFNLGSDYSGETVLGVLRHLALYWSDKPPARLSERRAATARITVVPGYFALLDELERDDSDALNFTASNAESWVVENMSDNGYGALVPSTATDWIRVGELVGVQVEGASRWGVGIVRRVVRDEQRQYHVGIEIVSRTVILVRSSHEAASDAENAMLLSTAPDTNGEVGLVMRAGRFDPGSGVEIAVRDKSYRFTPSRMIDAGDDFDWAAYKVAQEPA